MPILEIINNKGRGGGGDTGFNGGLLRQESSVDKGLFISSPEADLSWHLQGAERDLEEDAVAAKLLFGNQDEDADLAITLPLDWLPEPETVNAENVAYTRYPNPSAEVKASASYGPLGITSVKTGAAGNVDEYRAVAGTPQGPTINAVAEIEGSRSGVSDHDGIIKVRSPNIAQEAYYIPAGNFAGGTFRWWKTGTGGNGARIQWFMNRGQGSKSVAARYSSGTHIIIDLNTTVTGNAADTWSWNDIAAAVNAARFDNNGTAEQRFICIGSATTINIATIPASWYLAGGSASVGGVATNSDHTSHAGNAPRVQVDRTGRGLLPRGRRRPSTARSSSRHLRGPHLTTGRSSLDSGAVLRCKPAGTSPTRITSSTCNGASPEGLRFPKASLRPRRRWWMPSMPSGRDGRQRWCRGCRAPPPPITHGHAFPR